MLTDELSALWNEQWPHALPIGSCIRADRERWVRFHSLPGSKRYADTPAEYQEILRRHNTVLNELASTSNHTAVLVLACSYSSSEVAVALDAPQRELLPDAEPWQSLLVDEFDGEQYWTHVYCCTRPWEPGELDALLTAVADDEAPDLTIAAPDLRWLYHPYDGGADVIATSVEQRNELRRRHSDWLSPHAHGL